MNIFSSLFSLLQVYILYYILLTLPSLVFGNVVPGGREMDLIFISGLSFEILFKYSNFIYIWILLEHYFIADTHVTLLYSYKLT